MSNWPYPDGVTPRQQTDHELRPEKNGHTACPQCGSTNLRPNGSYTNAWEETRQAVECRDCSRGFYLPLGVHVDRKRRRPRPIVENALCALAEDRRPTCPTCGGKEIQRKGVIHLVSGGTTQRWFCLQCDRRFVSAEHRTATLDHRTLAHFDEEDPAKEAAEFFAWGVARFGPMASTNATILRGEIMISAGDRACLELMVSAGILQRGEVDKAYEFRERVLEAFDKLLETL